MTLRFDDDDDDCKDRFVDTLLKDGDGVIADEAFFLLNGL